MKAFVGKQYKHFKGDVYHVDAIAKSHEFLSTVEYVVYSKNGDMFVRERKEWEGTIERLGVVYERFALIEGEH